MTDRRIRIRYELLGGDQFKREQQDIARTGEETFVRIKRSALQFASTVGAALSVREVVRYSDQWKQLEGRLRLVSNSSADLARTQQSLFEIAQRTRASFEGTATVFTRFSRSVGDNADLQGKLLRVTEAVNQSLVVSGASAQSAAAGLFQLSQGIAANALRGEELNSVLEQTPRLAEAIAAGMGVSIGQLRALAQEGKLTAQAVINALYSQADVINTEYAQMALTVEQSFTKINNAFLRYIGQNDAIAAGTSSLAQGLSSVADNFDTIANVATGAAVIIGGRLTASLYAAAAAKVVATQQAIAYQAAMARTAAASLGVVSATTAAAGSVTLLSRALAFFGGPVGLAVTGLAAAFLLLRDNTSLAEKSATQHEEALIRLLDIQQRLKGTSSDLAAEARAEAREHINNAAAIISEAQAKISSIKASQNSPQQGFRYKAGVEAEFIAQTENEIDRLSSQINKQFDLITKFQATLAGVREEVKPAAVEPSIVDDKSKNAVKQQQNYREELKQTTDEMQRLLKARQESEAAYQRELNEIEAQNAARKAGVAIGSEEYETLRREVLLRADLEKQMDALQDAHKAEQTAINESAEIYKDFARDLNNTQRDLIRGFLDGTINSIEDAKPRIKDALYNLLANIASIRVAPLVIPVVATVGGAIGLSGGEIEALTRELGGGSGGRSGGGGLGNLGALGDVSHFLGLNSGLSGVTNAINRFGSQIGFANVGADFIGPLLPGQTAGTTLSGFLGSTLSGAGIGALGANLLGLGSGNTLIDTGTSLAGAAIGNLFAPGIGGILGSFAGTALGGLFGSSSRPHPASNFGAGGFDASGRLLGAQFSSKHTDAKAAQALAATVSKQTQALTRAGGFDFSGIRSFQGGVDDGRGFFSLGDFKQFGSDTFTFDPEDEADAARALNAALIEMVRRTNSATGSIAQEFLPALDRVDAAAETALDDVAFLAAFDELASGALETEKTVSALSQAFEKASDTAERLGLSVQVVREGFARNFNDEILGRLNALINPGNAREIEINQQFEQLMRDAAQFGGNTEAVELLRQLTLQGEDANVALSEINDRQQQAGRTSGALGGFLFETELGKYSTLSPSGRLSGLRDRARTLSASAAGGDFAAGEDLAELLPAFLDLSSEINGFNTDFATDQALARELAQNAKTTADRQLDVQQGILSELQNQTELLGTEQQKWISQIESLLTPAQREATIAGRNVGALSASEFAINGLLHSRLSANPLLKSLYIPELARVQGFASGGLVTGGITGRDSVPIMAMPGERVLSVSQSRMFEQLASAASNDNRASSEIASLRAEMNDLFERMIQVLRVSGQQNVAGLGTLAERLSELASAPRLRALT